MMRACSHAVAHVTARASAKATRRCSRSTTRRAFVSASLSSDDADAPEKAKRRTLGFVGAGSMAEAMAKGFVSGGVAKFEDIAVSHSGNPLTAKRWRDLGVSVFTSNVDVLNKCDTVFLAVKPHVLPSVLREVVDSVDIERHLFVSVAAGVPSNFIEEGMSCSKSLNSKESEGKTKAVSAAPKQAEGTTTKRTPTEAFDPAAGKDTYTSRRRSLVSGWRKGGPSTR